MGEGYIEPVLRWKIAYTVSQTLKCPFCVDVTVKMLKSLIGLFNYINRFNNTFCILPE